MRPLEAWRDYLQTHGVPDHPRLRAIFLGGFSAGMGWVADVGNAGRKDAMKEIIAALEQSAREQSAREKQPEHDDFS